MSCEYRITVGLPVCGSPTSADLYFAGGRWLELCPTHVLHFWPDGVVPENCFDPWFGDENEEQDEDEDDSDDSDEGPDPDELWTN